MRERILVPLDGSPLAETVLPHACDLLTTDGELVLFQVISYPLIGLMANNPMVWATMREAARDESETYLRSVSALSPCNRVRCQIEVAEGPVADEILFAAARLNATAIALCAYGAGGVGRWMTGGVAGKVMSSSPIPVLLYRPPADNQSGHKSPLPAHMFGRLS
jgi:nucleotide-binding universal stress UspA family protein